FRPWERRASVIPTRSATSRCRGVAGGFFAERGARAMGLSEGIRFFAATDVGRVRDHNEDNYLVDKKLALFIVADGMGGHAAGEVASALAVRTVHEEVRKQRQLIDDYEAGAKGANAVSVREVLNLLEFAVQRACARIHEEASAD